MKKLIYLLALACTLLNSPETGITAELDNLLEDSELAAIDLKLQARDEEFQQGEEEQDFTDSGVGMTDEWLFLTTINHKGGK